ncbi:hypothetical protein ISCGN_024024 [Ixodes scapularis]
MGTGSAHGCRAFPPLGKRDPAPDPSLEASTPRKPGFPRITTTTSHPTNTTTATTTAAAAWPSSQPLPDPSIGLPRRTTFPHNLPASGEAAQDAAWSLLPGCPGKADVPRAPLAALHGASPSNRSRCHPSLVRLVSVSRPPTPPFLSGLRRRRWARVDSSLPSLGRLNVVVGEGPFLPAQRVTVVCM